jgi:hypothetical protein
MCDGLLRCAALPSQPAALNIYIYYICLNIDCMHAHWLVDSKRVVPTDTLSCNENIAGEKSDYFTMREPTATCLPVSNHPVKMPMWNDSRGGGFPPSPWASIAADQPRSQWQPPGRKARRRRPPTRTPGAPRHAAARSHKRRSSLCGDSGRM